MNEQRLVLLGGGAVGKSAITIQFIQYKFEDAYDPTIEDTFRKQSEVDNKIYSLEIQDTSGQDDFNALRDQHIKAGEGFVVVYSITSRPSFMLASQLIERVLQMKADKTFPLILVSNKIDLEAHRLIKRDEGFNLAQRYNIPFFETSAKTGENVHAAFSELVRTLQNWRIQNGIKTEQDLEEAKKKMREGKCVIC